MGSTSTVLRAAAAAPAGDANVAVDADVAAVGAGARISAASAYAAVDIAGSAAAGVTDRPLKIALLTHSVNPRGGVVHTLELAQALHAAGHDVTVLAPALPGQAMFRTVGCRLQLVRLRREDGNGGNDGNGNNRGNGANRGNGNDGSNGNDRGNGKNRSNGNDRGNGDNGCHAGRAGRAGVAALAKGAAQGSTGERSRSAGSEAVAAMVASRIAAFERHLATLLAHESFDVLHAQDPIGANALANLQDRGAIAGFIRTVHHLDPFDGPAAADRRLAAWQRRGFERATQVACVSRLWCEVLRDGHGIDAALVHNGVDCARFTPHADGSDARVAERHGLRDGRPVVLAVGGIEQRKNTQRLLDAFIALRAGLPHARLVIAGGASLLDHDDYAAAFRARAAAAGLPIGRGQAIVLTGTLPDADMPALYRAAAVLAMPSLREGFGLAVLEALACGTPVVASRIAPFTEYLNLNVGGDAGAAADCIWADPLDAVSIAAALRTALLPGQAAESRAAAVDGPPALCRRFGWPASAARHVALYRACAALGRPLSTAGGERRATAAASRPGPAAATGLTPSPVAGFRAPTAAAVRAQHS